MVYFFFYNHLLDEDLIKCLDQNSLISNAFIYINYFDKIKNQLLIQNLEINNDKVLEGKLVFFPTFTLPEIIDKLSQMDKVKYKDRSIYKLEKIKVFKINGKEQFDAYIIY